MRISTIFGVLRYPEDVLEFGLMKFDIEGEDVKFVSSLDLVSFKENDMTKMQTMAFENIVRDKLSKDARWIDNNMIAVENTDGLVILSISVMSTDIPVFSMEFPMELDVSDTHEDSLVKWSNYVSEKIRNRAALVRTD